MEIIIRRKINIEAAYDKVFEQVADFKNWKNWSPWYVLEPDMKQEITGNAGEVGHKQSWKGLVNGEGTNTLVEKFDTELAYDLNFIKPFKSQAKTRFYFEANNSNKKTTDVVWELKSNLPWFLFFKKKLFTKLMEKDYDRGLMMLKDFCETGSVPAETTDKGISSMSCVNYIGIERKTSIDKIGPQMKKDFDMLSEFYNKKGKEARDWFSIYKKYDFVKNEVVYVACASSEAFDSKLNVASLDKSFKRGVVPGSRIYKVLHVGDYKHLGNAWTMGMKATMAKKLKQKKYPIERYVNVTADGNTGKLETEVIFPIK